MADDSSSLRALTEEVTVQQVVLDSLEDETFEGADQERQLAREELERLKRLLRAAKHKHNVAEPHHDSERRDDEEDQHDEATPGPSSEAAALANPTAMSTPTRITNPWVSPASWSFSNRKRDADAANLSSQPGQNKSQRTTPIPTRVQPSPVNPSSAQSNMSPNTEVIDLTGEDDGLTADLIAAQIKDEKRREQERADRRLAKMLYDQDAAQAQSSSSSSSQVDAFSRIMSSQLPRSLNTEGQQQGSGSQPEVQSEVFPTMPVPGSYNPRWDEEDPFSSRPAPQTETTNPWTTSAAPAPVPANPQTIVNVPFRIPFQRPPPLSGERLEEFNRRCVADGRPEYHDTSTTWYPELLNRQQRQNSQNSQNRQRLGLSSRNNSALSQVINRTSGYNYTNGTDGFGKPLPEGLTDFLHDAFHDPTVTAKELDDLLQNITPDMEIPERNRDGTPAGLKRSLYHHQELALTWMKKMEEGTNKGGILADDMGLGKTISTLALILSRPATTRPKTNLIVGPVSLIRQWEEEIRTKTKLSHRLSVYVYHNKKTTTDELLKYDVVLTTYGTIAAEWKKLDALLTENSVRKIDFNDRNVAIKIPLLHPTKATFYRVILDEAQCIKNHKTMTAKGCASLDATYRWCLTGTPMMNGVYELYSLLWFLGIKPYHKWETFRKTFGTLMGNKGCGSGRVAMDRLRALLKAVMLRRKKNSQLDGKPILNLPKKTEEIVYATLSPEERDFYYQLEKSSQVQFSKYLREGSIGKNYSHIFVLLLRLRQACCHPHLNLDVDDINPLSSEDDKRLELVKTLDKAVVERIKAITSFDCDICTDVTQCPTFFIPCGHGCCTECLCGLVETSMVNNVREGNESTKAKCHMCRNVFDPTKCFSYETFQKVHMAEEIQEAEPEPEPKEDLSNEDDSESEDGSESEYDSESELDSDDEVDRKGNLKDFIVDDEHSEDEDLNGPTSKAKKKNKKGKKKASDIKPSMLKTLRKEAYKNREAFKKYMRYLRKTWLPAAKVTECMNLIEQIRETGEKTIVFSQWTLLLDLIEVAMHHSGMDKPVRYDGSMSATNRNHAAHRFREKDDVKVMLVSLRAGNAGLNLTAASRVIIMDPFWNPYIEMQAVDRAYRIGQQKEVKVYRILTKDTVEDRIVDLQNQKKELVEAALDEAAIAKIGRLGTAELKFLFNSH